MERCLEIVEGAKPNSSVIWQTQSSPRRRASRIRTRFGADSALAMAMNSRIDCHFVIKRNKCSMEWLGEQAEFPAGGRGLQPAGRADAFDQRIGNNGAGGPRLQP